MFGYSLSMHFLIFSILVWAHDIYNLVVAMFYYNVHASFTNGSKDPKTRSIEFSNVV